MEQLHDLMDVADEEDLHAVLSSSQSSFQFDSTDLLTTVLFALFSMCLIYPPTEAVSAGLTVENMAGKYLGSEIHQFVQYHIKRTCLVWTIHSLLPLTYYVVIHWWSEYLWPMSLIWHVWLQVSILLPLGVVTYIYFLCHSNWDKHPIAKELSLSCPGQDWRAAASNINAEYTRPDKFAQGAYPGRRVVVTENWILQTSPHHLHSVHQSHAHLVVVGVHEHAISTDGSHDVNAGAGVQFLDIAVHALDSTQGDQSLGKVLFNLRLNSMDFEEISSRLSAPLRHAQDVVVQQSLNDRFIAAFQEFVSQNPVFILPASGDVETCLGCMRLTADVKLLTRCRDQNDGEEARPAAARQNEAADGPMAERQCQNCFCRPMWCCSCLARWFAARQRLANVPPQTWLEQKAPCPTCRAVFCPLDVAPIQGLWNAARES